MFHNARNCSKRMVILILIHALKYALPIGLLKKVPNNVYTIMIVLLLRGPISNPNIVLPDVHHNHYILDIML